MKPQAFFDAFQAHRNAQDSFEYQGPRDARIAAGIAEDEARDALDAAWRALKGRT